jgi:hypothetical protein
LRNNPICVEIGKNEVIEIRCAKHWSLPASPFRSDIRATIVNACSRFMVFKHIPAATEFAVEDQNVLIQGIIRAESFV